jgi:hypothetical protein
VLKRTYKQPHNTYFQGVAGQQEVLIRKAYLARSWKQVFESKQVSLLKSTLHPLLGSLLEILKEGNKFFFVYEGAGQNLLPFVRGEEVSLQKRVEMVRQVTGLFKMLVGSQKVLFRQVRTDSFFMRGENPMVVELDGIHSEAQEGIDFCYSAPEVLVGSTGHKSIVFSLGCLAFEVLTGQILLACKNEVEYMYQLCALFPNYF